MKKKMQIVVLSQCPGFWQEGYLTLEDLAQAAGVHPATVVKLVELGLVEFRGRIDQPLFSRREVSRLHRMIRLRRDLGINWAGLGLVIDLLETVENLEKEISRLKA